MPELVVVGLDALDPFFLQKWVDSGYLPTFKKLIENGVFGKLKSTIPPVTIPAWPAMFTGKNPGKLGVFDFFDVKKVEKGYTLKPFSPASCRGSYVWDILGSFGKKSGIINFPELFKSYEVNGFMVNSLHEFSTYPEKLAGELEAAVPNSESYIKHPFESTKKFKKSTSVEWKIDKYLRKNYNIDLFVHVFRILDVAMHHASSEEKLKEVYMEMDKELGDYLEAGKNKNVLIVSDHGGKEYSKKFYVNSYLKEAGYLKLKNPSHSKSFIRSLSYSLLNTFPGLEKFFDKLSDFFTRVTGKNLRPSLGELFSSIDWDLSEAFAYTLTASNFVGFWLLKKDVNLKKQLLELKDPESEQKIVKNIFSKEEIYNGPMLNLLPDLVAELDEEYLATSELGPFTFCNTKHFAHQKYGTIIAYGDDFKEKMLINNAEIVDVAPTILHMLDVPIPEDMDGKVLKGIFREGSNSANREIKRKKPVNRKSEDIELGKEDEEAIKKRLKSLGYF
jgi:predicted AlkP superfamily phosphohydrolase/phosphomutase